MATQNDKSGDKFYTLLKDMLETQEEILRKVDGLAERLDSGRSRADAWRRM